MRGNKGEIMMSNPIRDLYEKTELERGIAERDRIIYNYQNTWFLDRDNAIKKIKELRIKDEDVAAAATASASIATYYVPFNQATNDQIVEELIRQKDFLKAKLSKKLLEEQN